MSQTFNDCSQLPLRGGIIHRMEGVRTKLCRKCDLTKPVTEFPKNGKPRRGIQPYKPKCKVCGRKPRVIPAYLVDHIARRQSLGLSESPADKYVYHKLRQYEKNRAASPAIKQQRNEYNRNWRSTHPEEMKLRYQRRRERQASLPKEEKDALDARKRGYYEQRMRDTAKREQDLLKERARYERNRIRKAETCKQWRKQNPVKVAEYGHKHRARKKAAQIGEVSYARILARDGMFCYLCSSQIAQHALSFDHVIPLSRGGAHSEDNVRPAHRVCNMRKQGKLLDEIRGDWLRLAA